ncbi:MAG: hypothetical protein ACRYFX_17795 [Janthinobacterium lividum]
MNIDLSKWNLLKAGQIEDEFEGFDDEMVFELTDGTVYYQSVYKYNYFYSYRPTVKIYSNGYSKIIVPDGMNDYAEIEETTAVRSKIVNDFSGWSGDTIFELQNGQIWKQDKYQYKYLYAHRPDATIVKVGNNFFMNVKGKIIRVKKIK